VFDGKGGSQRRRKIYPPYKENRKPPIRLNRSYDMTTDEQEEQNMKYQLVSLVEILSNLPVNTIAMDHIEADDTIAYLSQLVTKNGGESIIYSTDKDFFQLATKDIIVYNPVKKKTYSEAVILDEYGIHPKHFHFFRALNGDKSDNINGVKGVGEITLKKYLPEIADPTLEMSVDFIRQKYATVKKVPKMISNILANEDIVDRNLQLMDLHEGIISVDSKLKILSVFNNTEVTFSKHDLTRAMSESKLLGAFPNYDEWLTQTFIPLYRFRNDNPKL
jgi:5'-3' exonuclease